MIYDAQAWSGPNVNVMQALDKALDILRASELYAPHILQVKEEDPLTHDYVGGLCDVSTRYYSVGSSNLYRTLAYHTD